MLCIHESNLKLINIELDFWLLSVHAFIPSCGHYVAAPHSNRGRCYHLLPHTRTPQNPHKVYPATGTQSGILERGTGSGSNLQNDGVFYSSVSVLLLFLYKIKTISYYLD